MSTISFTEFQKDPAAVFARLDKSREPVRITREGQEGFILFPESNDTAYLLSSPKNAARLEEAEVDFQHGQRNYHERKLIEE